MLDRENVLILVRQIAADPSDPRIDANFDVIRATVDRLLDGFLAMLPLLAAAILVFVLLLFAARGVRYMAEKALRRSSNRGCGDRDWALALCRDDRTGGADRGDDRLSHR